MPHLCRLGYSVRIQARDPAGFWYNAKVISKRGTGMRASVIVHYIGFGDCGVTAPERGRESGCQFVDKFGLKTYPAQRFYL